MKLAVLYQATTPPAINNIVKPLKSGGYSDSGADIAFNLSKYIPIITPVKSPKQEQNFDWVFPDTQQGINEAYQKGATVFWLNTVLFSTHPITTFKQKGISVVGQDPMSVQKHDDKWQTNKLLQLHNLQIVNGILYNKQDTQDKLKSIKNYPLVIKPVRGRGSQGVALVNNFQQLKSTVSHLFNESVQMKTYTNSQNLYSKYGSSLIIQEYLSGKEITITVMPPAKYKIQKEQLIKKQHWALPPVQRYNHINGIAPYSGKVAVKKNSKLMSKQITQSEQLKKIMRDCEKAAQIIQAKAPIRIDCRANQEGKYFIFDLNMKPNMTGPGRKGRDEQDNLCSLAAAGIGWDYKDLLLNILQQNWKL